MIDYYKLRSTPSKKFRTFKDLASMKLNKKTKIIISIVGISVCAILITVFYLQRKILIKEHKVAQATITDCYWVSRGTARYVVEGNFKIGNVFYNTSCQLKCQDLKLSLLKEKLLNLKVNVVYISDHPSISYLLIEQSAYNLYNVSMPDSLKWIDDLVKCK